MARRPRLIDQTLVDGRHMPITVTEVREKDLTNDLLQSFLESAPKFGVGVAPSYSEQGSLAVITFSTATKALLVHTTKPDAIASGQHIPGRKLLEEKLLRNSSYSIFAFDVHYFALSLYQDLSCYMSEGVDIQSMFPNVSSRDPLQTAKAALGQDVTIYTKNFLDNFEDERWDVKNAKRNNQFVQKAWMCQLIGHLDSIEMTLAKTPRVNTAEWDNAILDLLARIIRDSAMLDSLKPTIMNHEVSDSFTHSNGKVSLTATSFPKKFRRDPYATVRLRVGTPNDQHYAIPTQVAGIAGKSAKFAAPGNLEGNTIAVTSYGKGARTSAEIQRSITVLQVLQRKTGSLFDNKWINKLWVTEIADEALSTPEPAADSWGDASPDSYDPWTTSTQMKVASKKKSCETAVTVSSVGETGIAAQSSQPAEQSANEIETDVPQDSGNTHSEDTGWGDDRGDMYDPWGATGVKQVPSVSFTVIPVTPPEEHRYSPPKTVTQTVEVVPPMPPLHSPPVSFSGPLNASQREAVEHMLSHTSETDVTMIQGPPGTGKTSVITAFVSSILAGSARIVWLVAQSNVAVKNIAEKLCQSGVFDWKLIVSNDFYEGWHEHLYNNSLRGNLVASSEVTIKELQGCRVILCTLSMLSNRRFPAILKYLPLETLVIDEASQIEIGDYIPILSKHGSTLRKICFIGDDKQLPPYGQETVKTLQSVFEKSHLRENRIFLDTQYRMPPAIGDFISQEVYGGMLHSNPNHPMQARHACQFIDIAEGKEVADGTSWKNPKEVEAVISIVRWLTLTGRQFRIITPYDSQRTLLEKTLKVEELEWKDKCFNVDSFQGNEECHIIISVVRSNKPGFLTDERRTNVMLSRCKEAMYICSSQSFLTNVAAGTLVGRMAREWGPEGWVKWIDIVNGNFHY